MLKSCRPFPFTLASCQKQKYLTARIASEAAVLTYCRICAGSTHALHAAVCFAGRREEQERRDAELARQLQEKLDLEEQEAARLREERDREIAARLQREAAAAAAAAAAAQAAAAPPPTPAPVPVPGTWAAAAVAAPAAAAAPPPGMPAYGSRPAGLPAPAAPGGAGPVSSGRLPCWRATSLLHSARCFLTAALHAVPSLAPPPGDLSPPDASHRGHGGCEQKTPEQHPPATGPERASLPAPWSPKAGHISIFVLHKMCIISARGTVTSFLQLYTQPPTQQSTHPPT